MQEYDPKNPRTHKGNDLRRMTMKQLFDSYGLEVQTIDFIGHAIALHRWTLGTVASSWGHFGPPLGGGGFCPACLAISLHQASNSDEYCEASWGRSRGGEKGSTLP